MIKKMLINATHPEENRVAIVEDGILTELDIEIAGKEQTKGNIYKGVVIRVEPGLQAAFVDYGSEKLGFLQIGEIHPNLYPAPEEQENKGRPRITDILRRGQEIVVQIVKEERGTKGAALTTFLSLPGRYMVLMPESHTKGISRKIEQESQRKSLKAAMNSLNLPDNMGYIVRTAGIDQSPEELKRDFDYLVRLYENIIALNGKVKAPALLYKESNLVIRSIRDYFSSDTDEVLVDDSKVYQEARDFFNHVMPEYANLVKLHQERRPIFSRYQIEEQIESITKNQVPLPSGGSIVLDSTEALVAIDVNSGKMAGEQGVEATAYKTNLEAAREAGRQLRLRDLGGLIVIDFIDMRDRKHIREVERALKDALKNDKARVTVGRISHQFGLLEMSRQRIKATLAEGSYQSCPHCQGSGRIKSAEAQAISFLRKIQAGLAKGNMAEVEGDIPLEVATYLLNHKREELLNMERHYKVKIVIKGRTDFLAGQSDLTFTKREKDGKPTEQVVTAASMVSLQAEIADEEREPAEASNEEGAKASEEGKKKRRRRRRKRKPEQQAEAATPEAAEHETVEEVPKAAPTPAAEEAEKPAEEAPAVEEKPLAAEAAQSPEPEVSEEAEKVKEPAKPARRPRRRTKKPKAEEKQPEAIEAAPEAKPEQEAQAEAEPAAEEEKEKPKRRTRRTTKKVQPAETPVAEEPAVEPVKEAAPAPEAAEEEAPEKAEKPKRRTRRTTKKAAAEVPEEKAAESKPEEEKAEPAEEAKEKPKRRTRRTSKKAAAAEESAPEKAEAKTEAATAEGEDPKAEEKPKRRTRRTTKKAAETKAEETVAETAPTKAEPSPEAAEAAEKPKRRTRRTTKKTAETKTKETTAKSATEESAEKKQATEEKAPEEAEAKPKRRTRRTTAKAKTEESKTSTDEAKAQPEAEDKPKRRTRRTTKKADEAASKETAEKPAGETDSAEEKPKRRTRRTTKKAASEEKEAPSANKESTPEAS